MGEKYFVRNISFHFIFVNNFVQFFLFFFRFQESNECKQWKTYVLRFFQYFSAWNLWDVAHERTPYEKILIKKISKLSSVVNQNPVNFIRTYKVTACGYVGSLIERHRIVEERKLQSHIGRIRDCQVNQEVRIYIANMLKTFCNNVMRINAVVALNCMCCNKW